MKADIAGIAPAIANAGGVTVRRRRVKALTVDSDLGLWRKAASGIVEVPTPSRRATTPRSPQPSPRPTARWPASCAGCRAQRRRTTLRSIWRHPVPVMCQRAGPRWRAADDCRRTSLSGRRVAARDGARNAMGLLHVQQDVDPAPFIETRLSRIPPTWRSQSDQTFYSRTLNGYDYASIMHYSRFGFNAYTDLITMETRPAGIDVGSRVTYSTADVDALARLYATAPMATDRGHSSGWSRWSSTACGLPRRSPSMADRVGASPVGAGRAADAERLFVRLRALEPGREARRRRGC